MHRYFLEVSYKGTAYSGFQKQDNANSVQTEVEKAFGILQQHPIALTGASRTDAGVHALQNFFHFDYAGNIHPQFVYKMNAILPHDIVAKNIFAMPADAHCRFDAVSRSYKYYLYRHKDPFLRDRAYYYPYTLDLDMLQKAARVFKEYKNFLSFSKRNTQVKSFECTIENSEWSVEGNMLVYHVKANRFLRGMVRGLTGTMLLAGRGKLSVEGLRNIITAEDCTKANFSVPGHGLFLVNVAYPGHLLPAGGEITSSF